MQSSSRTLCWNKSSSQHQPQKVTFQRKVQLCQTFDFKSCPWRWKIISSKASICKSSFTCRTARFTVCIHILRMRNTPTVILYQWRVLNYLSCRGTGTANPHYIYFQNIISHVRWTSLDDMFRADVSKKFSHLSGSLVELSDIRGSSPGGLPWRSSRQRKRASKTPE